VNEWKGGLHNNQRFSILFHQIKNFDDMIKQKRKGQFFFTIQPFFCTNFYGSKILPCALATLPPVHQMEAAVGR